MFSFTFKAIQSAGVFTRPDRFWLLGLMFYTPALYKSEPTLTKR